MKLRWTPEAKRTYGGYFEYIWSEDPGAAKRIRMLIRQSAGRLEIIR
jgi:plasmid stabilization system protein ParE